MKVNLTKKNIITIFIAILLIFLIINCRKFYIISKITNLSKDNDYTNYHLKFYTYNADSTNLIEIFKNNNEYTTNFKNLLNLYSSYSYINNDTNECIQIISTPDNQKKAYVGNIQNIMIPFVDLSSNSIISVMDFNNIFNILFKIKNLSIEDCNGKKCYYFLIKLNDQSLKIWVDTETGLIVRNIATTFENSSNEKTDIIQDWNYDFNTVSQNEIVKPNLDGIDIENK